LKDQGRLTEAVESFQTALRKKPGHAPAHSAILAAMAYGAWVTPAELAAAHAEWDRQYAAPLRSTWRRHENVRDPARPLRLGFVSPDFVRHPVGFFLVRAWEHLDRGQYPVTAYSDRRSDDDFTPRLQAAASRWRAVFALSDEQLAEQIRGDAIDILFDLAGHTGNNRLLVLARKPAPIQITWIGYEGTTGLSAMDYLLADRFVVPPGSERHYREKVLRLPDGYVCYDPPELAPEPGPLPAIGQGSITFGSFSNPAKITPQVVALWARVLQRVPGSRLLLKYRGLDDEGTRRRFEALFAEQGIDGRRLGFSGWSSYGEMLDEYQQVDVALDPFPFSGSATTCEALWMGVPVITLPGETFASRHSLSHLTNSDQAETIARDEEQYVELAAGLAGDIPRLAAMRAGLRRQVAGSRLCDGPRFAGELMGLLRGVWREWAEERE
jgi:predicted O-linked N-acetylglucosamine transferase (SPINDLY family)